MPMILYDSPVSGNCYKVRQLFAHLGIEYERREVSVIDRSGRQELLGALNPGPKTLVTSQNADANIGMPSRIRTVATE